jgi:AcrR family transcriptional regulator
MRRENTMRLWIERGYANFATHGLEGIQVERIARELGLNKSSFYRYFGERELFLEELVKHHCAVSMSLANELRNVKDFVPDFVNIVLKYSTAILVQMQMARHKDHKTLHDCFSKVNFVLDHAILPMWIEFVGLPQNQKWAIHYFEMVRDMFYSRVNSDNLNYDYLSELMYETKKLIVELRQHDSKGPMFINQA